MHAKWEFWDIEGTVLQHKVCLWHFESEFQNAKAQAFPTFLEDKASLQVEAATPGNNSDLHPNRFAAENLLDGNLNRKLTDNSCFVTVAADKRPEESKAPYVNFTMSAPMELGRVEVLSHYSEQENGYGELES